MGKKKNDNKPLGWDDPLPDAQSLQWKQWRGSLPDLEKMAVRRCYHPKNFGSITRAEVHAFSNASQDAIGACVYLRLVSHKGEISTTLLFGQSRVAPLQVTSIPRLELCAAVLAVQAGTRILKEIDMKINDITYYTDSKVVLGYIQNSSRRFYVYVANRVQLIRRLSSPQQWRYIDTSQNPADLATRRLSAPDLTGSDWITGPSFLRSQTNVLPKEEEEIPLDVHDPEVRKEVLAHTTNIGEHRGLGTERFSRFSSLASLQRAIANLIVMVKGFLHRRSKPQDRKELMTASVNNRPRSPTVLEQRQAIVVIIRATQGEAFREELRLQHQATASCPYHPASMLRCDRGTNFIRGKSELDDAMRELDQPSLERYTKGQGCEWLFNPPHASHFGGVWERQIGTIRRVLDAMFLELGRSQLTHELLVTLMTEVTAIVNARPLTTVPSDADEPQPLSPAMLLTMKTRPLASPCICEVKRKP